MNTVSPIRNDEDLQRCYEVARRHDRYRLKGEVSWEILLVIGFATAFRISDISRLRVKDVRGRERVSIRAKKTNKEIALAMPAWAIRKLGKLTEGMDDDDFILQSRKPDEITGRRRPITRQRAYQIINEIARRAGIRDNVGCHTLRKTYGYHFTGIRMTR